MVHILLLDHPVFWLGICILDYDLRVCKVHFVRKIVASRMDFYNGYQYMTQ